jgi:16S rRNA (guanine966-N2)-methyltransferase
MRIVSGEFRGRTLVTPDTPDTRPTMDKTRQAVFNILRSASWAMRTDGTPVLSGARVLDVFAGSGALGLEALSQGASHATFIEHAHAALTAIKKNITTMKLESRTHILGRDIFSLGKNTSAPYDLVFLDPPYDNDVLVRAITHLLNNIYVHNGTLLVLEMRKKDSLPEMAQITPVDERRYGMSKILFARVN